MSVREFQIRVPESILSDLRERIDRTRWPDELVGSGWSFGADLSYMKELADYWVNGFDWRRIEDEVNTYPNIIAEIDGYTIHALHVKAKGKNVVPLVATHGWPGSFFEMMKLIPLLTDGPGLAFDLVIPSLIGYGYSRTATSAGCNILQMADVWHKLMLELRHEKFGAHGGDFGSGVSMALAFKHPHDVIGIHLNNIEGYYAPYVPEGESLTPEEIRFEKDAERWYNEEGGYSHEQGTKPLTLSYGLTDSPIGLCAWIIEKFYGWSDCRGNLENVFTKDELLATVTLYWITETVHSSIRLYHECRKTPLHFTRGDFVKVPVAIARFPLEEPFPPRTYIERGFNVQRWTNMPAGGHFPAQEKPELLASDIREFFLSLEDR